ncbi:MAG: hypothetical protein U0359_09335 [Byssovorax sp.]
MLRVARWLAPALLGLAVIGSPARTAEAKNKAKVEWSKIEVPEGEEAAKLGKALKTALEQAAKHANFGKAPSVTLSARITAFTTEQHGDVLRVSCTAVGRVAGGQSARSKISFGGSPGSRAELEKQVLTMVANGLVARLAQIARAQDAK